MKILFCKVAWMDKYCGETINDIPLNGGDNPDKWEQWNFKNNAGMCHGFVEPKHIKGIRNCIRIENLVGSEALTEKDKMVDGVMVVWCATPLKNDKRIKVHNGMDGVIVGWYKNATVYRNTAPRGVDGKGIFSDDYLVLKKDYRDQVFKNNDYRQHGPGVNVVAKFSDCTLLSLDERNEEKWQYSKKKIKLGQNMVWYGKADCKKDKDLTDEVKMLIKQIDSHG